MASPILEEIRKNQLEYRKARLQAPTALLTTLISECEALGKQLGVELNDAHIISVIKKFINNVDIVLESFRFSTDSRKEIAKLERKLLEQYLPPQLSEEELRVIIDGYIDILGDGGKDPRATGKIMGMIKLEYDGRFDGKLAANLVKEMLSK